MSTVVDAESLAEDNDYSMNLSRAQFETLLEPIFQRCMQPLPQALADARLTKDQVDEVILVGGSTRIYKIQSLLTEFFDGK